MRLVAEAGVRKSRYWMFGMTAVAALASVFLLAGCGENVTSPVGSGGNGADSGALDYVLNNYGDPFALGDSANVESGSLGKLTGTILIDGDVVLAGPNGGTVGLQLGSDGSSLAIPSAALTSSVLITALAVQVTTPLGDVTFYDFGPDGLVFKKSATLTLETNLPNGKVLSLYWYNPAADRWVLQQTAKVDKYGNVKFTVDHFSKYGIS